ncbi:hypothetical protein [Nostoc sp. CALU 546]|uniref:hypothetical protein n=1 Tax=Nostoc sp. CALU 546 TaxID=1867241 RepID=UPI003B6719C7
MENRTNASSAIRCLTSLKRITSQYDSDKHFSPSLWSGEWGCRYWVKDGMALRKDTALILTGSQPPGWESILGGSASGSLN